MLLNQSPSNPSLSMRNGPKMWDSSMPNRKLQPLPMPPSLENSPRDSDYSGQSSIETPTRGRVTRHHGAHSLSPSMSSLYRFAAERLAGGGSSLDAHPQQATIMEAQRDRENAEIGHTDEQLMAEAIGDIHETTARILEELLRLAKRSKDNAHDLLSLKHNLAEAQEKDNAMVDEIKKLVSRSNPDTDLSPIFEKLDSLKPSTLISQQLPQQHASKEQMEALNITTANLGELTNRMESVLLSLQKHETAFLQQNLSKQGNESRVEQSSISVEKGQFEQITAKKVAAESELDSLTKMYAVLESHPADMTIHSFWLSNVTLLLYYLKKDTKLISATGSYQLQLSEFLQDIFTSLIEDAKRRISGILDSSLLDSETISGMENLQFERQWRVFRSRSTVKSPPSPRSNQQPPSPRKRAAPSPRNLSSLLSSIEFILEAYDVHYAIILQIIVQIFHWLGAEIFNRILAKRAYHARSRAMQIRLNVSALEDWLRTHMPYTDREEPRSKYPQQQPQITPALTASKIAKDSLGHAIQLLQWLQCLTSMGNDAETVRKTIETLDLLNTKQLLKTAKEYRLEVGEPPISPEILKQVQSIKHDAQISPCNPVPKDPVAKDTKEVIPETNEKPPSDDQTKQLDKAKLDTESKGSPAIKQEPKQRHDELETLFLDSNAWLPFVVPTLAELVVSYGAGIGGVNRERERKYTPSLPPEFIDKLDAAISNGTNRARHSILVDEKTASFDERVDQGDTGGSGQW